MQEVKYIHNEIMHNTTAASIIYPIIFQYFKPKSVLDVGCGIGTWLEVLDKYGITDYLGIDGHYVPKEQLHIPSDKFISHDLELPFDLKRKFDFVVSLEVAEHLSESAANTLINSLVKHGNIILFSAAIPFQEGQNHYNLQWPDYWINKFKKHGYVFSDLVRNKIWNDERVESYYRQNIFLIFNPEIINEIHPDEFIFPYVHPVTWEIMNNKYRYTVNYFSQRLENCENGKFGIQLSWRILIKAIKIKIKSMLKK